MKPQRQLTHSQGNRPLTSPWPASLGSGQGGLFPLAADTRDRVVTCCGRALGSGRPTLGLGGSPTTGLPGQKSQDIPWGHRESRLCGQVTASSRTFIGHSQLLGCGWERHSTDTAHSPPHSHSCHSAFVSCIHSLHQQPASEVPILYQASWRDTAVTTATIKSFPSDLMTLSALQRSPGARRTCVREC